MRKDKMRYWNFIFEGDEFWIEVDPQGCALRQIIYPNEGNVRVSCFEDCLAEGIIDANGMGELVVETSREMFEGKWIKETDRSTDKWYKIKDDYPIGARIEGTIKYFYPQGPIIQIGDALGVCINADQHNNINVPVRGVVKGYDDINMWVVVSYLSQFN